MKRKIISMLLALAMICQLLTGLLPIQANAVSQSGYTPYASIEYGYSTSVQCGTIRYIRQSVNKTYFYAAYWPTSAFGGYSGPGNECGTACISMALSYVGVNKTPKEILEKNNGYTVFDGSWGATYRTTSIATGVNDYINGNGKYSPVIIHLNYGQSVESNDPGHFVLIIGKVSDNVYQIMDPATESLKNYTINGSSITYMGVNNTIDSVRQYYNANASRDVTVTFNANGGSCGTSTKTVTVGSAIGTLPTATRSGYTFDGWYTAASGGNKITTSTTFSSNTTIYAHWTANTYTVSYNANGGTGAPGAQTKTHNVSLQLSSIVPTRDGYTFQGWATSSSAGTAGYQPGDYYTLNSAVTLYAVWSKDECKHNYSTEVIPATCEDFEKTVFTCKDCGYTYTEYTAAAYSEWSETKPTGVDESLIETKTQYRYSDYETTTSYESSMSGWTQIGSEWQQSGSGSIQYVKGWPSGFLTSHSLYGTYNKSPKSASETTTDKTTINSDKTTGYLYYHWCRGTYAEGPINRGSKSTKQGEFTAFHAFYSTTNPSSLTADSDGSVIYSNGSCCKDSYWYFYTPVNTQTYTTYRNLFTYGRWKDWSAWGDTAYTASSTRKVETRTMYRYSEGASAWSEEYPETGDNGLVQTKVQYRYADKQSVTSYEPSIDGYTVVASSWQQSGTGSVIYAKSWPSGFSTSHSLYSQYNKSPKSASETNTDKTAINSDKTTGYLYYHWCRGTYAEGPINRGAKSTQQGEFTAFHAFYSTTDPSSLTADSDGSVIYSNGSCCKDSYWYFYTPVNTQTYTTYRKLFTHERWGSWSDWSDTIYTASDSRKIETRTLYRTITSQLGEHEWNGGSVTAPATCTQDGVKTYTCTVCAATKTEAIPKVSHDYQDGYCGSCGAVDPDYNFVPLVLTVGDVSGYPGDTITVPVTIADNEGFAGFTLTIGYDETAMTLTDIRKGALLNTSESGAFTKNVSGGTINWVDALNTTGDGELMTLTFQIIDTAPAGSYAVTLGLKDGNATNFVDENSCAVRTEFVSGSISVAEKDVEIASGYSGALSWTLTDDGILTFSGEGKMKNYEYKSEMPWYSYREQIKTVVLEEGVTSIGAYAFYGMPNLVYINIASTVTSIGDYAFKNAPKIDNVVLPEGLTSLGDSAFYACTSLSSIEIPAALWTIKPYTFKNCTALAEVTFHEGNLMKISDGAFYNTALTELKLPDCLSILDTFSFKNCAKLTSIELGSGLTELREAVFYATAIPTITVPDGITKIGPYVFKNCVKLETVELPSTLTSVGEASFYACTKLASLELPDAVTKIGNYAFRKCEALRTVTFSESLQNIGESSFYGCESLYYLEIPGNVTTIQGYAFKGCLSLGIVELPDSLKTIGDSSFHTCTDLDDISIPGSVTKIGDYCFSGSTGIGYITFEGDAPAIGTGAFNKLTATAYYPGDNTTWTASNKLNYGGSITWIAN